MRTFLLRLLRHTLSLTRPAPPPRRAARTVLILQYAMPLGCCVHGTPLYAAIKAAEPDALLVVATRGTGAATLAHDPHIDHLITTTDPLSSRSGMWAAVGEMRNALRALRLRPAIVLEDASSRRGTYALFAAALRLAPTAGFAQVPALYDHFLEYDPSRSLIDNNLRLLAVMKHSPLHREPAVYFSPGELAAARALLAAANPGGAPVAGFVMQGSGGQRTGWHDTRFAEVIEAIAARGFTILYLGTKEDEGAIQRIRQLAAGHGSSLAGKTSIPELSALLCQCDLLVTLDTGTMHVGRATEVPMVVLGPSWQKPLEWLPLGKPQVRILRGADRSDVPEGYRLDEIEVVDVLAAATELTEAYPPSGRAREARVQRLLSSTRV